MTGPASDLAALLPVLPMLRPASRVKHVLMRSPLTPGCVPLFARGKHGILNNAVSNTRDGAMAKKTVPLSLADAPLVNRAALVLIPTVAFLDWTRTCPDPDPGITLADLREDPTVVLIPEGDDPEDWVEEHFLALFENELDGWCTDTATWPRGRDFNLFSGFLDVHLASMVLDLVKGPLRKG